MMRTPSLIPVVLALLTALLLPAVAAAQASPVSELWREWAVLEQQWRAEQAEVKADHRRLLARREKAVPKKTVPKGSAGPAKRTPAR